MVSTSATRSAYARWRAARRELSAARDALIDAERVSEAAGGRRVWATAVVVVVLAAALAGFAVWRAVATTPEFTDAQVVQAARDRVTVLLSADSDDPSRAKAVLAGATGDFYDTFAQSADSYTEYIGEHGAHGTATIDAAVFDGRRGDDSAVLVVARVRVDTKSSSNTGDRRLRLRVVMTPEDGALKMSGVRFVS
ncbi:MAG: hypothetical protein QM658_02275 [Gordonia sp. (in: high G+C Gram-positive bacteria)]